ncbi:MAG: exopolyphosphatase [Nitrospinae bacterium]|nr:exopolyphosphatase [Nitrospinota bacterium]
MRLVTRSDFDGLACAVLLVEAGVVTDYHFVHPKDVQDGKIIVGPDDVLANVPFAEGCGLWFDHHASEHERLDLEGRYTGASHACPSAARVIWNYYGGLATFDERLLPLMEGVDKADAGAFTPDEVLHPVGWALLSFIMDPRTGLGRYHDYTISNYELMARLIECCRTMTIEAILELPDVRQRVERYFEQEERFQEMIAAHTRTSENVIVTDLRGVDEIFTGNRFVIYALYPRQNVSVWVVDGKGRQNTVFAVGHSILNRSCKSDIGKLMLLHGGGGHERVGTCQVPHEKGEETLVTLIETLVRENR